MSFSRPALAAIALGSFSASIAIHAFVDAAWRSCAASTCEPDHAFLSLASTASLALALVATLTGAWIIPPGARPMRRLSIIATVALGVGIIALVPMMTTESSTSSFAECVTTPAGDTTCTSGGECVPNAGGTTCAMSGSRALEAVLGIVIVTDVLFLLALGVRAIAITPAGSPARRTGLRVAIALVAALLILPSALTALHLATSPYEIAFERDGDCGPSEIYGPDDPGPHGVTCMDRVQLFTLPLMMLAGVGAGAFAARPRWRWSWGVGMAALGAAIAVVIVRNAMSERTTVDWSLEGALAVGLVVAGILLHRTTEVGSS